MLSGPRLEGVLGALTPRGVQSGGGVPVPVGPADVQNNRELAAAIRAGDPTSPALALIDDHTLAGAASTGNSLLHCFIPGRNGWDISKSAVRYSRAIGLNNLVVTGSLGQRLMLLRVLRHASEVPLGATPEQAIQHPLVALRGDQSFMTAVSCATLTESVQSEITCQYLAQLFVLLNKRAWDREPVRAFCRAAWSKRFRTLTDPVVREHVEMLFRLCEFPSSSPEDVFDDDHGTCHVLFRATTSTTGSNNVNCTTGRQSAGHWQRGRPWCIDEETSLPQVERRRCDH